VLFFTFSLLSSTNRILIKRNTRLCLKLKSLFCISAISFFVLLSSLSTQIDLTRQTATAADDSTEFVSIELKLNKGKSHIYLPDKKTYKVTDYTFNFSNNSQICPSNNCEYDFNTGQFSPSVLAFADYWLSGRLKVSESSESKFYKVSADLNLIEEKTIGDTITKLYQGSLSLNINEFQYEVTNATLVLPEGKNPTLKIQAQS
jgi:hypothetical protein